jgi:hypothetical protein
MKSRASSFLYILLACSVTAVTFFHSSRTFAQDMGDSEADIYRHSKFFDPRIPDGWTDGLFGAPFECEGSLHRDHQGNIIGVRVTANDGNTSIYGWDVNSDEPAGDDDLKRDLKIAMQDAQIYKLCK